MRVQKTSFLKYLNLTKLIFKAEMSIFVSRTFFKSLPMCSIVPDCGDDIKIAWGYKKNKVKPRNKVWAVRFETDFFLRQELKEL